MRLCPSKEGRLRTLGTAKSGSGATEEGRRREKLNFRGCVSSVESGGCGICVTGEGDVLGCWAVV